MMSANNRVHYGLMVVLVYILHYIIIIIMQTYLKVLLVGYILSSVCLRLSQFPRLPCMQYIGLCVFSLPINLMMIVRIRVLYLIIIIKSEVLPICHCLAIGQGHEQWYALYVFLYFYGITSFCSPLYFAFELYICLYLRLINIAGAANTVLLQYSYGHPPWMVIWQTVVDSDVLVQSPNGDLFYFPVLNSGPRFNIKIPSYQYRKSHCGDKTVVRSSYLHNGISYTGKMISLYRIRALYPRNWLKYNRTCYSQMIPCS